MFLKKYIKYKTKYINAKYNKNILMSGGNDIFEPIKNYLNDKDTFAVMILYWFIYLII